VERPSAAAQQHRRGAATVFKYRRVAHATPSGRLRTIPVAPVVAPLHRHGCAGAAPAAAAGLRGALTRIVVPAQGTRSLKS